MSKDIAVRAVKTFWQSSIAYIVAAISTQLAGRMLLASGRVQECEICKATENLHVHHIDGDHNHNVLENLTWVCVKCHNLIKHPRERDANGRFVAENKLKEVM